VIQRGPQIASREDPDVGSALLELFHEEGIDVLLQTRVSRVEGKSGAHARVHTQSRKEESIIEGSDLLVAMGRTPNTQGIGLEQAGVELNELGYIRVNERLETTAPLVWAMGECAGSPKFTHVAFDDFRIVHANLNGGNRTTRNRIVPFCLFTDPVMARVGLNETEARSRGIGYRLAKMPMADILKTRTLSEPRGFLKILIGAQSDEILGFTALGVEGSELMAVVQTAMIGHLPYTTLGDGIFAHPTVAEGLIALLANVPAKEIRQPS
jgi:pyruvate/2-oxoglutarate dehydrogenase complex dihydrolipoamide dehydrogenase (E3) component